MNLQSLLGSSGASDSDFDLQTSDQMGGVVFTAISSDKTYCSRKVQGDLASSVQNVIENSVIGSLNGALS